MKKIILMLLVGLFFAVGSAQAKGAMHEKGMMKGHSPEEMQGMMEERMEMMTKDLNLNEEQQSKVQAIMKDKMDKKHAIMEEKQKAMEALHEDFKAKLKGVLSEEQMAKWEAKKEEMGDMKGKCPMCEKAGKGKMCPMCKMHQGEKGEKGKDGKGHEHGHKE